MKVSCDFKRVATGYNVIVEKVDRDINSLIAETTSKASPEKGVSKLAAWTTVNKCRIGIK